MPSLSEFRNALASVNDQVRRGELNKMHDLVQRDIILYASNFSMPTSGIPSGLISINDSDIQSFMSVLYEISAAEQKPPRSAGLDLIIHSPGGSLGATENIVKYLRAKYDHIRVFVPLNAMSAATMIACAADEIHLGYHSALGPTDPQISFEGNYVAAQSVIDEFERAKEEVGSDLSALPLWSTRIGNWPPGLLANCTRAINLSQDIVAEWLHKYMGLNSRKAKSIAQKLADAGKHKAHDRRFHFEQLQSWGLNIKLLEDDQNLQEAVLSIFHSTTVTFENTKCVKIVENHLGKGVYQMAN